MRIITELMEDIQYITEANGNGSCYIEGIFLQSDKKNKNGRIYPRPIMEREVARYNREMVSQKRALGELGHPKGAGINLERVSHMIESLTPSGSDFIGRAKILRNTPYGQIAESLIREGARLGVSSRGMGSVEDKNGTAYVKEDFRLATAADIVADPSAPDAFVRGLMEETEWIFEHDIFDEQQLTEAQKRIRAARKRNLAETKLFVFESLLESVKNSKLTETLD